ncbi:DUF4326 domain-containing protein, partial [Pseudomonas syringae group genomosp. 7]|uniref:DUF4326 domain-containing protein n=1 Tax=Pseudomonas syringae group genomosp. 7 TaxID=251699 RepID=UPI00376F543E
MKIVNSKSFVGRSVYIGRPSVFGNPFVTGVHTRSREESIAKHRAYFLKRVEVDAEFRAAVLALNRDATLRCFCAPLACHGDVIKE